ncbi:terminase small subunit [Escherichia coli]|nr:terminase small subunit [Escherichia coli]
MPEQYDEKPQVQQVAQIINGVFSQLLATFPASLANRDQNELNEIRRQWVLAFRENGITTMEQVNAGMRVARRQNRPFLPSPGQFVAWCREEASVTAGLPNASELVDMVYEYCRKRGLYPDAESYPWKSNAHYWLVEYERHRLTRAQADAQELKNARDSAEVVETAFCTFVLSRIAGEIASILDGIPLSVQRRFPELENRHVDFLKRDIIKAMNKAAALDELIPGLLSEYIEQSG